MVHDLRYKFEQNKRVVHVLFILLSLYFLIGCNSDNQNETIDLSAVVDKPVSNKIQDLASKEDDQKGHYEFNGGQLKLVDNGERVINYSFDGKDTNNVKFQGKRINDTYGAKVVVYGNVGAFVSIKAPEEHVKEYFTTFVKELGRSDSMHIESTAAATVSDKVKSILLEAYPGILKAYKGDIPGRLLYPQRLFWKKGNVRYFLTLDPIGDNVNLKIDIISEKAFKDRIVMGYHVH